MEIENLIRHNLLGVLPERIGVSHGFVIDSAGAQSRQMDIVLYDRLGTPKIYASQGAQLFPVEGVYACGEVKTKLDATSLTDAYGKCSSFKDLVQDAYDTTLVSDASEIPRRKPLFFCVAYESTELGKLYETVIRPREASVPRHMGIDCITILNNDPGQANMLLSATMNPDGSPSLVSLAPVGESRKVTYPAKKSWAMFVAVLLKIIVLFPSPTIDVLKYHGDEPF